MYPLIYRKEIKMEDLLILLFAPFLFLVLGTLYLIWVAKEAIKVFIFERR